MRPPSLPAGSGLVDRRTFLRVAGTTILGTSLAACTAEPEDGASAPALQADDLAVQRAVATAKLLRAEALTLAPSAIGDLIKQLNSIVADHTAHLAALGSPVTASQPPSPDPSATQVFNGHRPSAADLLTREWAGGREALRDSIGASSAGLAVLLGRIAAARAVHADLLAGSLHRTALPDLPPAQALPASTPSPSSSASSGGLSSSGGLASSGTPAPTATPTLSAGWLNALNRLLAGEHAAVYAYPLVIVQLAKGERDDAITLWEQHQESRNQLTQTITDAGATAAAADPAYAVGRPRSAAAARKLAASLELGLAGLAGDALGAAAGNQERTFAAQALISSARHSAGWSRISTALPGLPARQ